MNESSDQPSEPPSEPPPSEQPPGEQPPGEQPPGEQLPSEQAAVPMEGEVPKNAIAQFVTTILNPEEQVGRHVVQALQHENTVAVLTTVAMGPDGKQRVISAALSPERMKQVQEILTAAEQEREAEEPCVGFHCLIKPKTAKE